MSTLTSELTSCTHFLQNLLLIFLLHLHGDDDDSVDDNGSDDGDDDDG